MLNIPAAIEALIKSDNVRKNFRVKFPNGEHADLTNDDIVAESVRFQESVCSGETFKFGSADSSVIEFETVGVPNILGMTIQCVMEYAVPAALQATYGTWYGIPYGTFVVDSCPRDHQSMAHRKVTAYSRRFTNAFLPAFERWKMSRKANGKIYSMNPYYFLAQLGVVTPGTETVQTGTTGVNAYLAYSNFEDGQTVLRRVLGYYPASSYNEYDITDLDAAYRIDMAGSLTAIRTILENHHLSPDNMVVSATLSITNPGQTEQKYHIPLRDNGDGTLSTDVLYPRCPQIDTNAAVHICLPLSIEIRYQDQENSGNNWTETAVVATATTLTKLTGTGAIAGITLAFNSTLMSGSQYTFYNAYSLQEIITGFAELNAGMVRTKRDGTPELIYLDNSSPYALTAANVMDSAWWDEYDVAAIGTVRYDYLDQSGTQYTGEYDAGSGASVYDMTGNYILNHLKGATAYYVEETLLHDLFRPRISTVIFTPLDANFNGLTFLQAGDAIELTAADGTVIESYILDQTFGGVQLITQDVNTVQGEVVSNEY